MALNIEPEVGNWYMNMTGRLIKVWAVAYTGNEMTRVVIEFLNAEKRILNIHDWNRLELEIHLHRSAQRRKGEHFHH